MQGTTLSFANLHNHGELFANILRARRETTIVQNQWTIPDSIGVEYDQYDTPQSRWIAVHDDNTGRVLAGVRLTPTTAKCGIYSYMIRDAQNGLLAPLPSDLLDTTAPVQDSTWEVTRGFFAAGMSDGMRAEARAQLVMQMRRTAREEGISKMLALLPTNWDHLAVNYALETSTAGREMTVAGTTFRTVWIDFSTQLH